MTTNLKEKISIKVELLSSITDLDLADICNITEEAIKVGGGFGWLKVPPRSSLKNYWKGLILVQNKILIVGRLNNSIAGTLQLTLQPPNNEAQKNIVNITSHFVAPWARGYGLAKAVFEKAEYRAKQDGFKVITLEVRETQNRAIQLYEQAGFIKCGTNPKSAYVNGNYIAGHYYYKELGQ